MPEALSASDLCISRSGALTTAEISASGRAAVFIPSPNVTANHQYYNAMEIAKTGGAVVVTDNGETVEKVTELVKGLCSNRAKLDKMGEASRKATAADATDIIYKTIIETQKRLSGQI